MAERRDRFDPTDPASIPPDQRLHEVGTILATGVIRMREQRAVNVTKVRPCRNWVRSTASPNHRAATCMPKISPESGENCLELSRQGMQRTRRGVQSPPA